MLHIHITSAWRAQIARSQRLPAASDGDGDGERRDQRGWHTGRWLGKEELPSACLSAPVTLQGGHARACVALAGASDGSPLHPPLKPRRIHFSSCWCELRSRPTPPHRTQAAVRRRLPRPHPLRAVMTATQTACSHQTSRRTTSARFSARFGELGLSTCNEPQPGGRHALLSSARRGCRPWQRTLCSIFRAPSPSLSR